MNWKKIQHLAKILNDFLLRFNNFVTKTSPDYMLKLQYVLCFKQKPLKYKKDNLEILFFYVLIVVPSLFCY